MNITSAAIDNGSWRSVPESAAIDGWFAFTTTINILGSCLLILLLITSLTNHKLHRSTGFLIVHLTCLQLFLCAVSFPLANVDAFRALSPGRTDFYVHCSSFMFFHLSAIQAESWASFS